MRYRILLDAKLCISSLLLITGFITLPALAAESRATVAGYPAAEALRLGEAMFQKGVLPSGAPLTAIVQGDLEISGNMSTCANCHLRSGLGSIEGGILTTPTNGAKLYAPLRGQVDIPGSSMKRAMFTNRPRPAYTDETLATALTAGVDPTGRTLSETMPRYELDDVALKILINYLKNLSSTVPPGVTEDEIRFATIVTDEVSPGDKDALLLPLTAYLRDEWNARESALGEQWNATWYGSARPSTSRTYRKGTLDVWELKGSPETWGRQLEAFYTNKPVFAVLGGIVPGKWAPIHDFCEKQRLPCIFPVTDLPVVSGTDWYTLYFSKGFYQEGETAAKYLSRVIDLPADKQVVQVFRESDSGQTLARGFADTWKKLGNSTLINRTLAATEKTGGDFWKGLAAAYPNAVMIVWLAPADLAGIDAIAAAGTKPSTFFFSATMLAGVLTSIPDSVRDLTYITYPTRLPGDEAYIKSIVTNWMKFKKIPVTNMAISAKTYVLTRVLTNALIEMVGDTHRDYFLDILDSGIDSDNISVAYPMLTFGSGQRYAAKGCYVVTLDKGENPKVVRQSDWVIY